MAGYHAVSVILLLCSNFEKVGCGGGGKGAHCYCFACSSFRSSHFTCFRKPFFLSFFFFAFFFFFFFFFLLLLGSLHIHTEEVYLQTFILM